jgi:predicted restriction endonuclease
MGKLSNYKSDKPCIVCGLNIDNMVTYHHIYTRKAHPEYSEETWNLLSVCQQHHNEIHNKGTITFSKKYPQVNDWLIRNGWELDAFGWSHQ